MKKRVISGLLAVVMLVSSVVTVSAAGVNVVTIQNIIDGVTQETVENYKFVVDENALGEWEAVDIVDDIHGFRPGARYFSGELYWKDNTFLPNGTVVSTFLGGFKCMYGWTKGLIVMGLSSHALYSENQAVTVSNYKIKNIGGSLYMFAEWKSADYTHNGFAPCYFVFKKKSDLKGDEKLLAEVTKAKKAVEAEVAKWSSVPSDKRGIIANQKIPYRITWLAYANATYKGKTYTLSDTDIKNFKQSIDEFEQYVEELTNNNVDVINECKVITRKVEATNEHTNETTVAISPRTAKPEIDKYAPLGETNFVYTVSAVPHPGAGSNYRSIYAGQGYASSDIGDISKYPTSTYSSHYLHEMQHSFEFRSAAPIDIEMPLLHLSCCEFPVGYEKYQPGNVWDREMGASGEEFLKGNIRYTDPSTKKISYVGIYPTMWTYVIKLHAYLASVEMTPAKTDDEGDIISNQWTPGIYYLKGTTLYRKSNNKAVLKNVVEISLHVAKTKSGKYYYIGDKKITKLESITKKTTTMGVNGDGWVMLFADKTTWQGDYWYCVTPEGEVALFDNTKTSNQLKWL